MIPQILIVGFRSKVDLEHSLYDVATGFVGLPYKRIKTDEYSPVIRSRYNLPTDFAERQIIIYNQNTDYIDDGPKGEKTVAFGVPDWWANCKHGYIDPRPRILYETKDKFNRLLKTGALFVIFADARRHNDFCIAKDQHGREYEPLILLQNPKYMNVDNWGILDCLSQDMINVNKESGKNFKVINNLFNIGDLLNEFSADIEFSCDFEPIKDLQEGWTTIAVNKFEKCIASLIQIGNSHILLLPQMTSSNSSEFVKRLVVDILPQISPSLFPAYDSKDWLLSREYELPEVTLLKDKIEVIHADRDSKIKVLEDNIISVREKYAFLDKILTETGEELKSAVIEALAFIGFTNVEDVDKSHSADDTDLKEDLRIREPEHPILVTEIKGILGSGRDEDLLTASKYIVGCMRELGTHEVEALTIINHNRNLPALNRNSPFRQTVFETAIKQKLGLMSTVELYKLLRSKITNNWDFETIREVFYRHGVINAIPDGYQLIGSCDNLWKQASAFGFIAQNHSIQRTDRLSIETEVELIDIDLIEIMNNKTAVDEVTPGMTVGVKLKSLPNGLKVGCKIYKVNTP